MPGGWHSISNGEEASFWKHKQFCISGISVRDGGEDWQQVAEEESKEFYQKKKLLGSLGKAGLHPEGQRVPLKCFRDK